MKKSANTHTFFVLIAIYALAAAVFVGVYFLHPYLGDSWLNFPELP